MHGSDLHIGMGIQGAEVACLDLHEGHHLSAIQLAPAGEALMSLLGTGAPVLDVEGQRVHARLVTADLFFLLLLLLQLLLKDALVLFLHKMDVLFGHGLESLCVGCTLSFFLTNCRHADGSHPGHLPDSLVCEVPCRKRNRPNNSLPRLS